MVDTNSSQPDLLGGMIERLDGTVAQVSKIRQSLRDLEIELIELRNQCENAYVAAAAASAYKARREDGTAMIHNPHAPGRPGPAPQKSSQRDDESIWADRELKRKRQRKERCTETARSGQKGESKPNPVSMIAQLKKSEPEGHSTLLSPSPDVSSPRIPESPGSAAGRVVKAGVSLGVSPSQFRTTPGQTQGPAGKHAKNLPISTQSPFQYPQRPPTKPSPFPENIDLSSYPFELKCEGDGWFILFNSCPKVKRILDVNLVHTLAHGLHVYCVEFSRDGKWLATGCFKTAQIYDVETGIKTCSLDHENNPCVMSVTFSPDGKYLATGGDDKQIRLWDIAHQQIHNIFKGHLDIIWSLRFSPNGQYILSGSRDGTVHIWNVRSRTCKVLTIDGHHLSPDHRVLSMAISPDGRYVAVGSADRVVSIWEIPTGALVQMLRRHMASTNSVAFTPDGKWLISGGGDATLKCWDVSQLGIGSGTSTALTSALNSSFSPCLMNLTGHKDSVYSMAVSHDGTWIVSGSRDRNVLFWDVRTGMAQCLLSGHKDAVWQVDLSPIGNFLATASNDRQVRIWSYGAFQ